MRKVRTIETFLNNITDKIRQVKFYWRGKDDALSGKQIAPFGVDTNPLANMIAIYCDTVTNGEPVILGYINKNQLAGVGETRLYSTDDNGALKFYAWLKNDGTMELGGDSKHMVRFEELKTGFDQLKADLNDLVSKFNVHTHTGVTTGGGITGTTPTPGTDSTASIDTSKIEEIKTL